MKVISLPRGRGKTTEAVEWLCQDPEHRVVFVADSRMAAEVKRQLFFRLGKGWDLERLVMTPTSAAAQGLRGRKAVEVAIDDLENFLASTLGWTPTLVTMGEIDAGSTISWEDD